CVDAFLFQLNQWPQAVIQKILNLIGITLNPPQPSTVLQKFVLSAPQAKDSIISKGTQVATQDGSIVFSTLTDLTIPAYTSPAGQISATAGSTAVSGSGTTFTSSVTVGGAISFDNGTSWYV